MTLITGMLCTDGVVIGADSIITYEYLLNFPTVAVNAEKIRVIDEQIILVGAGRVGLEQRFLEIVERANNQGLLNDLGNSGFVKYLSHAFHEDVEYTKAPPGEYGALLAFSTEGKYQLCEFKVQDFQPRLKTDQLWFCSMGSGQIIADVAWRFLIDLFGDTQPDVEKGLLLTIWLLDFCIEASTINLSDLTRIAVLRYSKARVLTDSQLKQNYCKIEKIKNSIVPI